MAALVLALGILAAQDAPVDNSDRMKELEWLVGSWEGEGKLDEMPFTSQLTYEWTMNKNFIRHSYTAKADDQVMWQDTGMTGWDREKKKFVSFSFGLDGTIGTGEQVASGKDTWTWEFKLNSTDPRFREGRSVVKKIDADTFAEDIQTKKDGEYVTFMACTYKRVKADKKKPK